MSKPFRALERLRSLTHAWAGFKTLIKEEHNARVHLFMTVLVVALGAALTIETSEWLILTVVISLVWITEALNTAIENLADRVCAERDPLIGKCKDVAATAVLLASTCAIVCGVIIFAPGLITLLK